MKKIVAISSDFHVDGQFERGIEDLIRRIGIDKNLRHVDFYSAGDFIPFTENGWHEDPGYMEKKRLRKVLAEKGLPPDEVEKLAREGQEKAWDTHREEMIKYGLTSHRLSKKLAAALWNFTGEKVMNPLRKVTGNCVPIISRDQRKALELSGAENPSTMDDYLFSLSTMNDWILNGEIDQVIRVYDTVRQERYGNVMVVTIPYTENKENQAKCLNKLKELKKEDDVKEVYVIYHENRYPALVGMKGKPVMMQCLHEMVDVVINKYANAEINEVVGHNHLLPPPNEFKIKTQVGTFMIPVGLDMRLLVGATLVITPGQQSKRCDYLIYE